MCHSTKKVGTVTPRVSTNTTAKTTTPVPMDVSQMSSNISKPDSERNRRVTRTNTSKTRNVMEMKCMQLRERAKGGFKGTCFKCGMTGHKADRCWQKGNGKGSKRDLVKGKGGSKGKGWSKGKWSNSGHSWDSSWYNSHWHGKTSGLEVDPWSAVELVPYFCAVILSSSCEKFSEPKRMTRGTHTKTSQPGGPKNFAHVSKFSILAPDDNEFTGKGCTSLHM